MYIYIDVNTKSVLGNLFNSYVVSLGKLLSNYLTTYLKIIGKRLIELYHSRLII